MASPDKLDHPSPEPSEAAAIAADVDVGARDPSGWPGHLIAGIALLWSLFQLYYASNFPYLLTAWTGLNRWELMKGNRRR